MDPVKDRVSFSSYSPSLIINLFRTRGSLEVQTTLLRLRWSFTVVLQRFHSSKLYSSLGGLLWKQRKVSFPQSPYQDQREREDPPNSVGSKLGISWQTRVFSTTEESWASVPVDRRDRARKGREPTQTDRVAGGEWVGSEEGWPWNGEGPSVNQRTVRPYRD